MQKKALLVIDMLRDFMEENGALYCGEAARQIISFIKEKVEEFHKEDGLVIYIMDSHRPDDPEFKLFPKHCVKGTWGAELIPQLKVQTSDILIPKTNLDGFYDTQMEKVLRKNRIDEVHFVGVCTSICVMETAGSLAKRGYRLTIYKDGVADFDQEAHRFALKRMKNIYGAKII